MMVLDYLNEALKKKGESSGDDVSFLYYEDVLKKLSTEVKSWTFISKGNAKYEFEDCDSAVFFLSYVWNLIQLYGTDLDFSYVCSETIKGACRDVGNTRIRANATSYVRWLIGGKETLKRRGNECNDLWT